MGGRVIEDIEVFRREAKATEWELVVGRRPAPFMGQFRAKNGALKGWWIGLAPSEPVKADARPWARLILVEDQKDAAGFTWSNPEDEEGR